MVKMCKGLASLSTCCLERAKELRARLGSFLQKPDWNLTCCKIGKHKPTLEECLRWKESFEKLLSCKYGLCAFTAFLVSEFSEENMHFTSPVKNIINIDHETRDITRANMAAPSLCCFDTAQHKIYLLMAKDCYPRFLRSPAFKDLLHQANVAQSKTPKPQRAQKKA
ncbi:hypothetical protein WMY93_024543 [Mugilogobius chulae]|uniref:RGS domain-containing protein n=1 Tax=Mugilogobius chulae TaxID=88201 RepID=A0AAW0N0X3_9GOBI